ncbi:MAG TPA: 4Fe-4S binding protein [Thermoanaerobaculia bacterium]|nr:4Fe-4S binding protein [Thermoanaerobaculia bacterium]
MAELPAPPEPAARKSAARKPVVRSGRDRSQRIRHAVQALFAGIAVAVGTEFFLWVREVASGAAGGRPRPAGIEAWLPIAGLMNVRYWAATGRMPAVHPAAMVLLLAFAAVAVLFRKAFCSWICPIGTLSERLGAIGRRLFGRNFRLPRIVDVPLRAIKYLLLGFFLWAIARMSADSIAAFMGSDYGLIADVKLLDFFRTLGRSGLATIGLLALTSVLVRDFWCRYLCPYGALMGLLALASPARIRRRADACIDCGKCAAACPASLPVDRRSSVASTECTGCFSCVAACPVRDALALSLPRRRALSPATVAATIVLAVAGAVALARATGHWESRVPRSAYERLVPRPGETSHPIP